MNANLWLLAAAQGLFLANNVALIAINGLVGLRLAPHAWMATLPVMGYVVGSALSTGLVARTQARWGRKKSFQIGLLVALGASLMSAIAVASGQFWWLVAATIIAGFYAANAHLYRFAAAELCAPDQREKAVSLVMAGGLLGAVIGPNLASYTRSLFAVQFVGAYVALAVIAVLSMVLIARIGFPPVPPRTATPSAAGRSVRELLRDPVFLVAAIAAAASYGVMNLLMAATPLAMNVCGMPFDQVALVLEWHVIGMFAPGFFTGHLIRRFGALKVMGAGVLLFLLCIAIALSGESLHHYTVALFLLGVGWNFLFTGSTTLSLDAYRPEEKDRAQGALNFFVFATMAISSFASGALVIEHGWRWLNIGSVAPVVATGIALGWLAQRRSRTSVTRR